MFTPDHGRADGDSGWPPVPKGAPRSRQERGHWPRFDKARESRWCGGTMVGTGRAAWRDGSGMVLGPGGREGLADGRVMVE